MKQLFILLTLAKISLKKQLEMLEVFESSEFIWNELNKENYYCDILSAEENLKIKELLNSNAVDIHLKGIEKLNIKAISIDDEEYPKLLKEIYDPPTLLYCKGDLSLLKTDCIAVVGARVCTRYGAEQTTRFTKELVKANFCIVSGLAEGIDGHAHRTALENGGKTIAVMAGGLNTVYPAIHTELFNQIAENGLLISENMPNYKPKGFNFVQRNRIIAGLSLGVFVPEASSKSGSLHTVNFANDNGRNIFVLPGQVDSRTSSGTNHLIKHLQASCVTEPNDIISQYEGHKYIKENEKKKVVQLNMYEQLILSYINLQDTHFDEIAKKTQIETKSLNSLLTTLTIRGLIKKLPGNYYRSIN